MRKILVVEDDPVFGKIYGSHLEKAGYEVNLAPDGESGWKTIQTMVPDAVLLDVMMPRMSGIEVLKQIRSTPTLSKMLVIVFTNAHVPILIESAKKAGADHVFDKITTAPLSVLKLLKDALAAVEKR